MNKYKDLITLARKHALPDPSDEREVMHAPLLIALADAIEALIAERDEYLRDIEAMHHWIDDWHKKDAELTTLKQKIANAKPVAWGLQMPGEKYPRQIWVVKDSAFESAMKRWPEAYKGRTSVRSTH